MTITKMLTLALRIMRNVNAVRRNRVPQRIHNIVVGRLVGRVMRKVWR